MSDSDDLIGMLSVENFDNLIELGKKSPYKYQPVMRFNPAKSKYEVQLEDGTWVEMVDLTEEDEETH